MTPKSKQNARQSRLRPKVGQVWGWNTWRVRNRITEITRGLVGYEDLAEKDSKYWIAEGQWLADRKAGVIRIVRGSK